MTDGIGPAYTLPTNKLESIDSVRVCVMSIIGIEDKKKTNGDKKKVNHGGRGHFKPKSSAHHNARLLPSHVILDWRENAPKKAAMKDAFFSGIPRDAPSHVRRTVSGRGVTSVALGLYNETLYD